MVVNGCEVALTAVHQHQGSKVELMEDECLWSC